MAGNELPKDLVRASSRFRVLPASLQFLTLPKAPRAAGDCSVG
jgi:hypothetical protein